MSDKYLEGQVALVTGASRGLGRAIALELAQRGAAIAAVARSEGPLNETVEAIRAAGGTAEPFTGDVANPEAMDAVVTAVMARFTRIDILVNTAGGTRDGLLARMKNEAWDEVINTNLRGAFNLTRNVGTVMIKQRAGKIVNISSVIGLIGNAGQANYAASKAGLIGFSKSVARELASRNVTCNVVCPGFIETEMTKEFTGDRLQKLIDAIPMKRIGKPEDIAPVVAFLCSPAAGYMTGQIITVDGGMVM